MDFHLTQLKRVCRICGRRVRKAKGRDRSYSVAENSSELAQVFGIDAAIDSEDTHPLSFCLFMHS